MRCRRCCRHLCNAFGSRYVSLLECVCVVCVWVCCLTLRVFCASCPDVIYARAACARLHCGILIPLPAAPSERWWGVIGLTDASVASVAGGQPGPVYPENLKDYGRGGCRRRPRRRRRWWWLCRNRTPRAAAAPASQLQLHTDLNIRKHENNTQTATCIHIYTNVCTYLCIYTTQTIRMYLFVCCWCVWCGVSV